jgi:hypothetical protein
MGDSWKSLEQGSIPELIRERVELLGAVFNRKVRPAMTVVFQEALEGYPYGTIQQAFIKAERELERFPTPKAMRTLCNESMPSQSWRYDFQPALGKDPETGKPIRVLIDPDPNCRVCRGPRSQHPYKTLTRSGATKIICERYVGEKEDEVMYRAEDCPEGRAFTALWKSMIKSKRGQAAKAKFVEGAK